MDTLINIAARVTGVWKKIAALLPLVGGAGSVLVGAGDILLALAHSGSASAALHVVQGLNSHDPNVMLIGAGLVALGINTNHAQNAAALQDHADALADHAEKLSDISPVK